METVVFVLMLLAVAAAHPFSPYTDRKEDGAESKNVQLSEEAVAAYLNSKMEVENLEPAKIMDYVEALLQKGKKTTTTQKPASAEYECLTGGTSASLKKSQLETIIDTVKTRSLNDNNNIVTILTPDHGKTMYINELSSPLSAYQNMLENIGTMSVIWANSSPCRSCAHALLAKYSKPEDAKPTIYIGHIYINNTDRDDLADAIESLKCLAKLKYKGFEIEAWNFNEFKGPKSAPVLTDTCVSAIDSAYGDRNFTSAYMELEGHVQFIRQLGGDERASSWCQA